MGIDACLSSRSSILRKYLKWTSARICQDQLTNSDEKLPLFKYMTTAFGNYYLIDDVSGEPMTASSCL